MITEERWDVIPNAEPADVFAARVRRAVNRIAAAHPDQRVAAFAHGGTIGQILAQATGSRPFALWRLATTPPSRTSWSPATAGSSVASTTRPTSTAASPWPPPHLPDVRRPAS